MSARTPSVLRRHPIGKCSASIPDRRRRPGSAPGPPAPALRRLGPGPPPAHSSSNSESFEQLPSIAPRWPHSESLGPECVTTWPAVRRRVALRSSIAGVSCCADGCLPSDRRARSESVSVSCAMVAWELSMVLIDLSFSHWTHVAFKHPSRMGRLVLNLIFTSSQLTVFPSSPAIHSGDNCFC
jgi:hypothetical protein